MRKIFLLLFSLSLGSAAMAQAEKYTLNISVADSVDVSEVYLYKIGLNESNTNKPDTIKIESKKATFTGLLSNVNDTPLASVFGEGFEDVLLVFEKGDINVVLGGQSSLSGTPLNDRFGEFRKSTRKTESRLKEIGEQFQSNPGLSNEEKEKLAKEATPLADELSKVWLNFTKSNISNKLGQFFALNFIKNMGRDDITQMLASAPSEFKSNPVVVARLSEIEAEEKAQGIGELYKDITLSSPDGVKIALSDQVGKKELVLIDFWASWCGPCIKEMPTLVKAYEQFKDKGFEIVGISLDSSREAWLGAINRLKMNWVHMSDLGGWQSSAAQLYNIQSIPQTLLVNKEGKVVASNLRGEALISKIALLLNK